MVKFKIDDRAFQKALKKYSELSSLKLGEVIKKRALNVTLKLVKHYRSLAPTKSEIDSKATSLGGRIKIRKSARKGSRAQQIKRELGARKRAITFTAMGWIVAAQIASIGIKRKVLQKFQGKATGKGKSKLTGRNPYVTLENTLPGAQHIEKNHGVINQVLKEEAEDMKRYIQRKTLKKQAKKFK